MLGAGFGLARYCQQLVIHLEKIDLENQFVLFFKSSNWSEFEPKNSNFKKVLADINWYGWEEQVKFKKIINKESVDLMHFPHWNVPFFYSKPFVVTVHDLIMFHFPRPQATTLGPVKFWIKDKIHRLIIRRAVKKAKHIITTSQFTSYDIKDTLGVDLAKMTTIYQAPFIESEEDKKSPSAVIRNKGIQKPYALYVGAAYPHKNLTGLLSAWKLFEQRYNPRCELILVGKPDYFYEQLQTEMSDCKSVSYLGFVPDDELVALYKGAEFYINPSLYEGFALGSLEAMSHGLPVVSSNRSCLPEVLGEAVVYVDPESREQLAAAMYQVLSDQDLRFELSAKAKEELKRYSWDSLAKKTLEIYKQSV